MRPSGQRSPVTQCPFQQVERALNIRCYEVFGAQDGPVNVALGGEMNDSSWLVFQQEIVDKPEIVDVAPDEDVAGIAIDGGQILYVTRISELIKIDYRSAAVANPFEHKIGANKARSASYKNAIGHKILEFGQLSEKQRPKHPDDVRSGGESALQYS